MQREEFIEKTGIKMGDSLVEVWKGMTFIYKVRMLKPNLILVQTDNKTRPGILYNILYETVAKQIEDGELTIQKKE